MGRDIGVCLSPVCPLGYPMTLSQS
ncbi:hypothetical protein F383_09935 [Gossypium arboreum]|uniref:Uncharacterized protein n=1 Tax=Gossypium arboreum TaxID=29729 RepID=A0A0B0PJ10_GOSAR|nr:hypothetical protein F383_09935 [Gossypium arboreum]